MSAMTIEAKTVEQWLNEVIYANDDKYVPSKFAMEFINFIKLVNGEDGEENKTPVLHYRMLDQIGNIAPNQHSIRIANMIHRGAAKTTIMGEYLFLYIATFGKIPGFGAIELAIYVSDSMENGVKNMRKNLEYRYENSDFLKKYVPQAKFTDVRWEFTNVDGNAFVVKGYGAKTGVRGTKEMGTRPRLAVLDDLVSDEDARSKTIIDSIKDTVSKAVEYALHPTKSMVLWQGTPFNANDPLYVAVESGAWQVNVFPVCERFPCTREEFRGSWPDRFTFDYVERQYNKALLEGKVEAFYQEMMLRIMSDDDRLILEGDIRWYSFNSFWKNRHNFNFYITTDFAVSEKQHADFTSINVWAVNHLGQWFWVDGVLEKLSMDKNIDILFKFAQKYMPKEVGIEVSGQQGGFIPWINDEMIRRNIFFSMASSNNSNKSGIRPVTDKLARFNTVVPWFKQGKMFFPSEKRESPILKEAIGQLLLVCAGGIKSKKDDFIDGTSQLSQLKVYLPSPHVDLVKGDSEGVGVWGVLEDSMPSSGLDSYIV